MPERGGFDAMHVFARSVPEVVDRSALEDGRDDVGDAGRHNEDDAAVARVPEPGRDGEDPVVEAQDRDFVERDDHFVHDLRGEEPLEGVLALKYTEGMARIGDLDLQRDDYLLMRQVFGVPSVTVDNSWFHCQPCDSAVKSFLGCGTFDLRD